MKQGDLVVPYRDCNVSDIKEPTFSSRGRSRLWKTDQVALVSRVGIRHVNGNEVLKLQIILDGEPWWIGAGAVRLLDGK